MEETAGNRCSLSFTKLGPVFGEAVVVGDPGRFGGRQVFETGIVGGVVDGCGAVVVGARGARRKVVLPVRQVFGNAEGPSEVAGGEGTVEFIVPFGSAGTVVCPGVGPHIPPNQFACFPVYGHTKRIPGTHHVDFRQAVLFTCKKISFRDAVCSVGLGPDSKDFTTQVVGVAGCHLGIVKRTPRAFINGCISVGLKGVYVVASGDVEVAVRAKLEVTAGVAALLTLGGDLQNNLFGVHIQRRSIEGESGNTLFAHRPGGVEKVDLAVGFKVRVQGNTKKSVLTTAVHIEGGGGADEPCIWIPEIYRTPPFNVQDIVVWQYGKCHGVVGVFFDDGDLILIFTGCVKLPLDISGSVQDPAQNMLKKVRLREGLRRVPPTCVPGPPAIKFMHPGDRMVVAHVSTAVAVFVERGQYMDVAAGIFVVVVPLIGTNPILRQVFCGGVNPVCDFNGCGLNGGVAVEVGTNQLPVPGPVVFGIRSCVDPYKSAALTDVGFKGSLLFRVQDVTGRAEEYDSFVLLKVFQCKGAGVLCGIHGEAVLHPELLNGGNAVRNRGVAKPVCF